MSLRINNNTLPLSILLSWRFICFSNITKQKNKQTQHGHLLVELTLPLQPAPVELSLWDLHPDPLVPQRARKMKIIHIKVTNQPAVQIGWCKKWSKYTM